MARTLELDTITEPGNSGTANITLSSDTTTTMPLVDINGGAIDATTLGAGTPSSVAATTLTASGATTLNGNVTLGNASGDTVTVTGTMAGIDNKSGMTGEIRMWGGASAPTGWLFCNGAAVSRSTYNALFLITSTSFGVGDGSSTFNVPDMEGRSPVGVGTGAGGGTEDTDGSTVPAGGSALTARSLGEWTGAEVLSTAQMAAHTHTLTSGYPSDNITDSTTPAATGDAGAGTTSGESQNHTHVTQELGGYTSGITSNRIGVADGTVTGISGGETLSANNRGHDHTIGNHSHGSAAHTHTMKNHTHSGTTNSGTGTGAKHTIPIMCVNFIIKT